MGGLRNLLDLSLSQRLGAVGDVLAHRSLEQTRVRNQLTEIAKVDRYQIFWPDDNQPGSRVTVQSEHGDGGHPTSKEPLKSHGMD